MRRETKAYLYDIQTAARLIGEFAAGKTFDDYLNDLMLRAAVEREFITIGEALTQLARRDEAVAARITDYQQIIGFRNVLVHGYTLVDKEIVWDALQNGLPVLLREVDALLAED